MSWKRNGWLPFNRQKSFSNKDPYGMMGLLRRNISKKEIGLFCMVQGSRISKASSAPDG